MTRILLLIQFSFFHSAPEPVRPVMIKIGDIIQLQQPATSVGILPALTVYDGASIHLVQDLQQFILLRRTLKTLKRQIGPGE